MRASSGVGVPTAVESHVWRAVQLFATCLGDLIFPDAVADAEALLARAPAARSTSRRRRSAADSRPSTRVIARPPGGSRGRSSKAFSRSAPIVCPSGSCATMVAHYLPELLGVEPFEVWELSAFLDDRGGIRRPDERGQAGRVPRLVSHAARAAASRTRRAGCSSAPALSSCRCRGRTCAAGSAARSR